MHQSALLLNMIEQNVGANSRITDLFVAKPIRNFGINGLSMLSAVCKAMTPPIKKEINIMIPRDFKPSSSNSREIADLKTRPLCGLLKTCPSIKKYLPICSR